MKKLIFLIVMLLIATKAFAWDCLEAGCKSESNYGYTHGQGI